MKVIVIIPAAGLGTRMASAPGAIGKQATVSKQFTNLNGTPILIHTLRKFAAMDDVKEIYIALRPSEIAAFRTRLEKEARGKKVKLVEGGDHRQESVANALAKVVAEPDDIILVHDAVRPFVTEEIVKEVIFAARRYGGAIAAVPAIDTVKQVERTAEGALIKATLPRQKIVMAQTPQGFRYDVLKKAFDEAPGGFTGTDEASLVERSEHEVAVVMGSPRNIKITTPADMELAEFYLQHEDENRP